MPSLRSREPGNIQEEQLPELKHIVLVDNTGDFNSFQDIMNDVRCAADFREIMVWREKGQEEKIVEEAKMTLEKDDIINLQFTR